MEELEFFLSPEGLAAPTAITAGCFAG